MSTRLQNKRTWLVGGALGALLIIAAAWFVLIGPKLTATSDLKNQTTQTRLNNVALQAKVSSLKQKSLLLGRYTASLKSASAGLPSDSGLPAFTRQLSAQANTDSVQVNSIMVGGVSAVAAAASTAPQPTTDTSTESSAPTTATSAPATAAGGLFEIQVTVTSNGTMAHQLAFLTDIRDTGPRRALITSIQLAPGVATATSTNSAVTLNTQLTIFSAPQSAAEIAALKKLLSGNIGN